MPPAHTQGALSGLLGRTAVAGHAAAPATASARPCRKKGPKSKSMSVDRASLHIPGRPIALRRLAGRGTEGLEAPQGRGQGRGPARRYQGVYGGVAGGAARPGARARAGGPRGRGPRAATGITAGGGGGEGQHKHYMPRVGGAGMCLREAFGQEMPRGTWRPGTRCAAWAINARSASGALSRNALRGGGRVAHPRHCQVRACRHAACT